MGLFDGLMGNSSEVDLGEVQKELEQILVSQEQVKKAYKIIRDMFVFTDKRLILVDKQGMTGRKVEYRSIPYRSIVSYSIENAGTFDLDAELKIWITGNAVPLQKTFNKQANIYELQRLLAEMVN